MIWDVKEMPTTHPVYFVYDARLQEIDEMITWCNTETGEVEFIDQSEEFLVWDEEKDEFKRTRKFYPAPLEVYAML